MTKLKTISAAEARQRFAEITDEVRTQGVSYSIIRHGKEVARLVAPGESTSDSVSVDFTSAVKNTLKKYDDAFSELAKL